MVPVAAKMTPDEFLRWERDQPTRHSYVGGEIFDMSGGSLRHNRLSMQAGACLVRGVAGGPCGVYSADQKLGLAGDIFVYADVVVLCPPIELRPGTKDVVTNPRVVVEVISKSTEVYDRGDKQQGYLALASVEHFVLISQREPRVEVYTRQAEGGFRFDVLGRGGEIKLQGLGATIAIDELYAGVLELPGD